MRDESAIHKKGDCQREAVSEGMHIYVIFKVTATKNTCINIRHNAR